MDRTITGRSTAVDLSESAGSTPVDQARGMLCRAVSDCDYTLDALQAEMKKDRAYVHKVLQGEKPISLEFIVTMPSDVQARYEQLRAESFGLIVVVPSEGDVAVRNLVSGLFGVLRSRPGAACGSAAEPSIDKGSLRMAKAGLR